jgi:hypothetical protein
VDELVIGSEALATGSLTRQDLRRGYVKIHHNVYGPVGKTLSARDQAYAAWLWSRRTATLAGLSAAAMHGARWLPVDVPAELARMRPGRPPGIVIHRGELAEDEVCLRQSIDCTTPARTAYDIGRRTPGDLGVIRVDALLNATRCTSDRVQRIADRYPGARGIRQLRTTLGLVDGGAESPRETQLRLLLVRAGFPRPDTQIPVHNERGKVARRIDMGWPTWKVGVEYDGEHHFTNAADYANDIVRLEFLAERGWTIVRVSAKQLRFDGERIIGRVSSALAKAGQYE